MRVHLTRPSAALLMLAACVLVLLLVSVVAGAQETSDFGILDANTPSIGSRVLLDQINSLRADAGLPPLALHNALNAAAQEQADWIVATGSYAHVHPDGSSPATRALAAGYQPTAWCCSENTFIGSLVAPESAWQFWNRSVAHYQNMLNAQWREVGIGTATGSAGTSWVLVFGITSTGGAVAIPAAQWTSGLEGRTNERFAVSQAAAPAGGYTVQRGDTLTGIAGRFGTTPDALMIANDVSSAIYPGQVLHIPTGDVPVLPRISSEARTYTIQRGDTLTDLAKRYGVTVEALSAANPMLTPERLRVGEALTIPPSGVMGGV